MRHFSLMGHSWKSSRKGLKQTGCQMRLKSARKPQNKFINRVDGFGLVIEYIYFFLTNKLDLVDKSMDPYILKSTKLDKIATPIFVVRLETISIKFNKNLEVAGLY